MQGARGDPGSVGYAIDLDTATATKFRKFMEICANAH
jgi:hypothetical protein